MDGGPGVPRFDRLEFDESNDLVPDGQRHLADSERDERKWLAMADDHRRRGLYENALRYYSRALELERSLVAGWLGQVQMLVFLGEYPEAELWARKALELFRTHGDLMAGRAQALGRQGDLKQAQELCDAALRQEGQSAYRWMVRGELLVANRDEIDRHCFDKAVQADPDWLVPLEIALIYLEHKMPSKGMLRARQAVDKAPQSFYCWYVQGWCEQELGLDRQAQRSLERCLELSPRHQEATQRLVQLANQGFSLKRGLRRLFGLS
jgi:tetratricopeptide (TPR) repeat protein